MTKDEDFARMMRRFGTPPQVMLLGIGNATSRALQVLLALMLPDVLAKQP